MKDYQNLIGKITIAILIADILIAQAITSVGSQIFSASGNLTTLIRDGLLQIGSAS